jgi:hypothetical protein
MGSKQAVARRNQRQRSTESDEDPRITWARVRREIDTLLEHGHDVPADLRRTERALMVEFMSQSQGR